MSASLRRVLLAALLLLAAPVAPAADAAWAAAADATEAALRQRLRDQVAAGTPVVLAADLLGKPGEGRVETVREAGPNLVTSEGLNLPVAWAKLRPAAWITIANLGAPASPALRHELVRLLLQRGWAAEAERELQRLDGTALDQAAWRETCAAVAAARPTAPPAAEPAKPEKPKEDRPKEEKAKLPKLAQPVLFNTAEADQLLVRMQIFPPNSAWHEDISKRPVLANSAQMIAGIGADKPLAFNWDMNFVIVPANQAKVEVRLESKDESDPGPYPVPANAPIEGWPIGPAGALADHQRARDDGDRHLIVVDPFNGLLYEFYHGRLDAAGWTASNAAIFDLTSNRLRPERWTSADAAGLPIFPAIVRFDEVERGVVNHALRFTVRRTRKAFIYPARHYASQSDDPNLPAMGQRFRLKAAFDTGRLPKHAQAVAEALKRHGMIVADNGSDWRISVAPDSRIQGLHALSAIKGGDFEVVQTTGADEGPRAGR